MLCRSAGSWPRYIQRLTRTRTDVALGPAHATFGELRTPTTESYKKVPIYLARANLNPVRRIKAGDHSVAVTFAFTLTKRTRKATLHVGVGVMYGSLTAFDTDTLDLAHHKLYGVLEP